MNTITRAYKIRAYPTHDQRVVFARTEGATRYVRNRVLREMNEFHKATGGYKSVIDMGREVTQWKKDPETSWLAEIASDPINQELRDLDTAFKAFFAKRAKYPKKKRKLFGCAIRFVFDHRHTGKVSAWLDRLLILPKLGRIKLAQPERLPVAMPKMVTLSRDGAGRFFVSFAVEETIQALPITGHAVGVDLGIKSLAVCSDGRVFDGAKALRGRLRHLKRLQRGLSRKQGARKGETKSNRYQRQARKVARLHARITDMRRWHQHNATTNIVKSADVIALEDLNVAGMLKNGKLARHIADGGFSEVRRQIEYKANWYGRTVVYANQWAPTSKTCSECGQVHEMPLSKRRLVCDCGADLDRDLNAAKNILSMSTPENGGFKARGAGNKTEASGASPTPKLAVKREPKAGHGTDRLEREAA